MDTQLEKDIEKMTKKLKGVKKRYRIEAGRYGGELVIGEVNQDFVDYWIERMEDGDSDLIEHVTELDYDDEAGDPDSPEMSDNATAWYEIDNLEHLNNAYGDAGFLVYEVPADGSDDRSWDNDPLETSGYHLYGREAYHSESIPEENIDDYVPVLSFHSAEKGGFGVWFVDVEGEDFDPRKLAFSTVETNVAEIIETVWYDKQELDVDFDYSDTTGKGYYASVGYFNKKWHDTEDQYTDDILSEEGYWDCYEEELTD